MGFERIGYSARVSKDSRDSQVQRAEGLLTKREALAAFDAAGEKITDHQLERWRGNGLLPRAYQAGLGKGRGSIILFDPATVEQAIEISRLFRLREKRKWVGWQLWLQGFSVDDRYWRSAILQSYQDINRMRARARLHQAASDADRADSAAALLRVIADTPFAASLSLLPDAMRETVFGLASDVLQGQFIGLSASDGRPNPAERDALIATLGAGAANRHEANGQKLNVSASIEGVLHDMSAAFEGFAALDHNAEPTIEARMELRAIIDIAQSLYRVARPQLGRSAFGLGILNRIVANPSIALQASMLIVWAQFRVTAKNILGNSEIIELIAARERLDD